MTPEAKAIVALAATLFACLFWAASRSPQSSHAAGSGTVFTLLAATPSASGSLAVAGLYRTESACLSAKATLEKPWVDDVFATTERVVDERKRPVLKDVSARFTWRPVGKCIEGENVR